MCKRFFFWGGREFQEGGSRFGQRKLQTMMEFWHLEGRKENWVGRALDCSVGLRKCWPGWWDALSKHSVRGTWHQAGAARSRTLLCAGPGMRGLVSMLRWTLTVAAGGCQPTTVPWSSFFLKRDLSSTLLWLPCSAGRHLLLCFSF